MKTKIILIPVVFFILYQIRYEYLNEFFTLPENIIAKTLSPFNSSERINIRVNPVSSNQIQIETPVTVNTVESKIIFGAAITGKRIDSIYDSRGYRTGYYVSEDGGENWTGSDSLVSDSGKTILTAGDPWVSINSDGRFMISYLVPHTIYDSLQNLSVVQFYMGTSISTNNGYNWSGTSYIPNANDADKDYIVCDNSLSSPYYGNFYAFFGQDTIPDYCKNFMFSVSSNGGVNWSYAKRISNGCYTPASIFINSEGEIFSVWSGPNLYIAKSSNSGINWISNDFPVLFLPNNTGDFLFGNFKSSSRIPISLTCDNSCGSRDGWLYITLSERFNEYDRHDISFHSSTNDGIDWSNSKRVNNDRTGYFKYQFMPVINVDDYGGINILYFDSRNTFTNDSCEIFMSRSVDGGNNFYDIKITDHKFKPENIEGLYGIPNGYGGSYIGISSGGDRIIPFWYDNSTGDFQVWTSVYKISPVLFHIIPFKKTKMLNGNYTILCKVFPVTSGISNVKFYSAKDTAAFTYEEMNMLNDSIWESKISINGEGIYKYYFSATDEKDATTYLPDESPDSVFYFVASSDTVNPQIFHKGITDQPVENWTMDVISSVTDSTMLDSVWVMWNTNSFIFSKEFKLNNIYGNIYLGTFNSTGGEIHYKDRIYYKIFARDNSVAHNTDSSDLYYFNFKKISLCEEFMDNAFPPANWDTNFTGTNYWSRSNSGSYGHDSSSAKYDFYNSSSGTSQSINSATFTSTSSNEILKFSFAHAPRGSGTDSLYIESSTNNGNTFSALDTLWGNVSGGELNTAITTSSEFVPILSQWKVKEYSLSSGINKFRFRVKSGAGNNLYIDSVCVKIGTIPEIDTIKLIPEGFYNLQTGMLNSKDTVRIYLRDTISPYIKIDSAIGILDSTTFDCPIVFQHANTKYCYLRVIHRNTLETWSRPVLYTRDSTLKFDLTDSASKAFGNNLIMKGSKFCIYSGEVNKDNVIDASDFAVADNYSYEFFAGYINSDITGDGIVDGSDLIIIDNNSSNFIVTVIP